MIGKAMVVSQAPPNQINVMFPSGQMCGYPIQVLIHGPADGVRVSQKALPAPGTWGIVAFPAGDYRNGIWIGAFYANLVTAFTNNTDPNFEYDAHWSGFYKTLDSKGESTTYYPDGTSIVIGAATTPAATYRNTVNATQTPQQIAFPPAERVPTTPAPFNITVNHPSGASVQITAAGAINVIAASGQNINFSDNGQSVADALVLVSKMVSEFNSHTHSDPQGGTTGTPTTPLTTSSIQSSIVKTSS